MIPKHSLSTEVLMQNKKRRNGETVESMNDKKKKLSVANNTTSDESEESESEEEQQQSKLVQKNKNMLNLLQRRIQEDDSSEEEEEEDSFSEDDEESHEKLLSLVKGSSSKKEQDSNQFLSKELQFQQRHINSSVQLQDLLGTVDETIQKELKQTNNLKDKQIINLKSNVENLKKIATAHSLHPMDDFHLQKEEQRQVFDSMEEQMVNKWENLVDLVSHAKQVPLLFKDETASKKKLTNSVSNAIEDVDLESKFSKQNVNDVISLQPNEEDTTTSEKLNKLSKQEMILKAHEMARRRLEISSQQEKFSRLKKIKSKAYRKVLRKAKEREHAKKLQQDLENNNLNEMDQEQLKEELLRQEKELIKERLTLKHKNTNKWIQKAVRYNTDNLNLKQEISKYLNKGVELRKKQTMNMGQEEEEEDRIVDALLDPSQTEEMIEQLKEEQQQEQVIPNKSLFSLKFMQRAMQEKKQKQMQLLDELRDDIRRANEENPSALEEEDERVGRKSFHSSTIESNSKQEYPLQELLEKKSTNTISTSATVYKYQQQQQESQQQPQQTKSSQQSQPSTVKQSSLNKTAIPKSLQSFSVNNKKETTVITMQSDSSSQKKRSNPWLQMENISNSEDYIGKQRKKDAQNMDTQVSLQLLEEQDDSLKNYQQEKEVSELATFLQNAKKEAFAGDELQIGFHEEKQKAVEDSLKMPDLELAAKPGWGSWIDKNNVVEEKEQKEAKVAEIKEQIKEELQQSRADNEISNVIIRDTALLDGKYFNSTVQGNEAAMRIHDTANAHPLGLEWNTISSFRQMNAKRVEPKAGVIIAPLNAKKTDIVRKIRKQNTDIISDETEDMDSELKDNYKQRIGEREAKRRRIDEKRIAKRNQIAKTKKMEEYLV